MIELSLQQKSSARHAIVAAAIAALGVKEDGPPYENCGVEVDRFLEFVGLGPGNPWCLAFAEYCVGLGLASAGLGLAESGLIKTGYCPALADHARRMGTLVSAEDVGAGRAVVRPGDIMLVWEKFPNPAESDYHHAGVIEVPPLATGEFHTIEGNTNTDGGREGYLVARQTRSVTSSAADGHPRYAFVMTV